MGKKTIEATQQALYERALLMDTLLLLVMFMLGLGALATLLVGAFSF